jgi:hypothetical protein
MAGAAVIVAGWPIHSSAQEINVYFPPGVYGYDQQLGVTVLTRAHPGYEAPGIRAGGFVISPSADQSAFYNTNFNGTPNSATWGSTTAASVSALSDWTRDSLGATFGVSHTQLFSFPNENYTDWNVGIAGGYTIDENQLRAAYYHNSYHQLGTTLGSVQSATPIAGQTDTADLNYTFTFGRLNVTPDISVSAYRYGTATVADNVTQNLNFLDRNVLAGGVVTRYSLSDEGGILVVARAITSQYTNTQRGQPSNNSNSFLLLGGLDYQSKSVWRYRLLVGVEVREFQSPVFPTHTAPIAEGQLIWQPTELTTVTGSLSRLIEDPQSAGTNGYVLTTARVAVDHELRRDIILHGGLGAQYAQFLQGSAQTNFTADVGAAWLINRNMRLSLGYAFTKQIGTSGTTTINPASVTSAAFSQNVVALALHLAI